MNNLLKNMSHIRLTRMGGNTPILFVCRLRNDGVGFDRN